MAKGRMSGSPFHVENLRYKYAVEHEAEYVKKQSLTINCEFVNKSSSSCNLWNSGHNKCKPEYCKYINVSKRKCRNCETCSYYYEKCYNPVNNCRNDKKQAEYCCYYEGKSPEKEKTINSKQNIANRLYLTERVEYLKSVKASKQRSIHNIEVKIKFNNATKESLELYEKLKQQMKRNKAETDMLSNQLIQLGGPLLRWPQQKK